MISWHTLATTLLFAAALVGCGEQNPPTDAGRDAGPPPELEIGSGGILVFEPVSDGDTVELARGCQGGQHVWISLRARHLDTRPALITLRGTRVDDGSVISIPVTVRLTFEDREGYDEITGLQLIIPDPENVLSGEIDISARVAEDRPGGLIVSATRRVSVVWGDEVCGLDGDGGLGTRGDGGVTADGGADEDGGPADGDDAGAADSGIAADADL